VSDQCYECCTFVVLRRRVNTHPRVTLEDTTVVNVVFSFISHVKSVCTQYAIHMVKLKVGGGKNLPFVCLLETFQSSTFAKSFMKM